MNTPVINALIYILGFVGLVSIGILPLRSWHVFRNVLSSGAPKVVAAFALLVIAGALWIDVQITARIFKCLTETYCGPSISSGWKYLGMLGVVYVVFEAVLAVIQRLSRVKVSSPAL